MESRGSYIESDLIIDNLEATELRLGLPGTTPRGNKRALETTEFMSRSGCTEEEEEEKVAAPVAKTQVVGWPPVRSYRKNALQAKKAEEESTPAGLFVKVSMDGAPYLRKIDLNVYKGYKELRHALDNMFKCFSSTDMESRSEFAIAYEDKDGDWMLAGDVPWEMFTSSCKRLRIMKGSEAKPMIIMGIN